MLQSFKMAISSIWSNKMRSFLTMLGIIIGVAAVIILVSIVNGYMNSIVSSFANMGVNQINISVTNTSSRVLEPDEMYDFCTDNADLFEYLSPNVNIQMSLKNGSDTMRRTTRTGVAEDYLHIKGYEILTGRNLTFSDCEAERQMAVLGYYTACELFGTAEDAIGQRAKLGGTAFTVAGVVERQDEDDLSAGGTDDFIWVPYTVAAKMNRTSDISSYVITSRDTDETDKCTDAIESFLYSVYRNDDFYTVTAMSEMLDELNSQIAMISGMLGGIAGISLLVAGVGVMNIMLVSVTERTREIGIRKALGAKRGVIMQQFVIEAAVTSSIGGLIGILVGIVLTHIVGSAMGLSTSATPMSIIVSFSVSVAIGLIFGYMPANRAAKLNPIDALRSE